MNLRLPLVGLLLLVGTTFAQQSKIDFTRETLDNGLVVIYAPMKNAPVVHTRLLYHVGSRDERPDRQGFAHMFEHMMFRGSAHVPPEEHMKLIGIVGGDSNAFTSFDQTTYVNTLPSNNTEMALWLEADRMASFKVNDEIFKTERKVVAEEWRMRYANQPLGPVFADLLKTAYTTHSYRWTPIGDMDQLAQSTSRELQEFFNTYYVPNNACLVIAGDIDVDQTKQWVHKYFAWIPRGADVPRNMKPEPEQTEARRKVVTKPNVPLTNLYMAYKIPDYKSPDQPALQLLGDVLASGRTGRLDRALVYGDKPTCVGVGAGPYVTEDPAIFAINAVIQQGNDDDAVEKRIVEIVQELIEKGITKEELDKVKTQNRQYIIRNRQTADDVAEQLAEEEVFGGDADRVNAMIDRLDAVTTDDVQRVAKQYLKPTSLTALIYRNGAATDAPKPEAADKLEQAAVVASDKPVEPRVKAFPDNYPTAAPLNRNAPKIIFNKGVEQKVDGLPVITMTDHRLPLVNVTIVFRAGSHAEPGGKEGLAQLTAQMIRRGTEGASFLELSQDLESRGITIEASDSGDNTRLTIACTTDQLDYAVNRAVQVLAKPTFPEAELKKLARQAAGGLAQSLSSPSTVVGRVLNQRVFAGGPPSRPPTPQSYMGVTIDDVKNWYAQVYTLDNAFIVASGDLDPKQGEQIAGKLLAVYNNRAAAPKASYDLAPAPDKRRITVVDNPQGQQSAVRMGLRAFTLESDEKFAGIVAGDILSNGIDSRLNKYVRAEKGLTYGAYAFFRPTRHWGEFAATVDTDVATTADAIEAMFKVFNDLRTQNVTDDEIAEARTRVGGGMAMEVQTIAQQAGRRVEQILNGYPVDYYDKFPERIDAVTAQQVKDVMQKYALPDAMQIVVVAPAAAVKPQVEKLGEVEVVPMPLAKPAPTTKP